MHFFSHLSGWCFRLRSYTHDCPGTKTAGFVYIYSWFGLHSPCTLSNEWNLVNNLFPPSPVVTLHQDIKRVFTRCKHGVTSDFISCRIFFGKYVKQTLFKNGLSLSGRWSRSMENIVFSTRWLRWLHVRQRSQSRSASKFTAVMSTL